MKNTENNQKIVIITGASNGMGYEAAKTFAQRGWQVYAGARRVEKIPTDEGIIALKLDVTDSKSNHNFVQHVIDHAGRIVNISSIGGDVYMPLGAFYHATKAALQQWSDVLDTEVKAFGIRSIVVQPGGTASNWSTIAMENA
ncbi:MAG: SDR family NAD(P)-dependent oxidoreductase, partial [Lactococcus garvieae]